MFGQRVQREERCGGDVAPRLRLAALPKRREVQDGVVELHAALRVATDRIDLGRQVELAHGKPGLLQQLPTRRGFGRLA